MIKEKNKAHKKYLKTRTVGAREYFVTLRNYVNEAIVREKTAYMKYTLEKQKNNPKMLWKSLSDWGISSQSSEKTKLPIELCKPEDINDYFINVAGQSQIDNDTLLYYNNNILNDNIKFSFREITDEDIYISIEINKISGSGK